MQFILQNNNKLVYTTIIFRVSENNILFYLFKKENNILSYLCQNIANQHEA